jgi:hypothetical protein
MAIGVSSALGASMALCASSADQKAWAAEIDAAAKARNPSSPLTVWLQSTDTGLSSRFIAHVMSGATGGGTPLLRRYAVPMDQDDFGRCRRLVDLMGWGPDIHRMAEESPEWAHIVANWDWLVELDDQRTKATSNRRLNDLIGRTP